MKHMDRKGKIAVKKWSFRGKIVYLGVNNHGLASKLERQNGAKCRSYPLK